MTSPEIANLESLVRQLHSQNLALKSQIQDLRNAHDTLAKGLQKDIAEILTLLRPVDKTEYRVPSFWEGV